MAMTTELCIAIPEYVVTMVESEGDSDNGLEVEVGGPRRRAATSPTICDRTPGGRVDIPEAEVAAEDGVTSSILTTTIRNTCL